MLIKANAKINLALDVLGERPNGYHDVKMIMQSVDLYDELNIEKTGDSSIIITCENNELECNESNLIYKAAKRIMEYVGREDGVRIELTKNIPIAAGMAGGSTDAAATLVGLNQLFNYGLSNEELREIGVKLGADIPFCIEGGTYLSEGIGEILTPVNPAPDCYLVIAKPDISVSTKFVYDNLTLDEHTPHPDVDAMLDAIKADNIMDVCSNLGNILELVTVDAYPVIADIKRILLEQGAINSLMSGSGPTVFGIFDSKDKAEKALEVLHKKVDFRQGFVTVMARQGIIVEA